MKRMSQDQRLSFRRRRLRLNRVLAKARAYRIRSLSPANQAPVAIFAPRKFKLWEEAQLVVRFIDSIRANVVSGKRHIILNFSKTDIIYAEAAILFYAELDRITDVYAKLKVRCVPPHNKVAAQVLSQIGFFDLIKMPHQVECVSDDVIHWKKARGQGALGEKYDDVLGHYDGVFSEGIKSELYKGITEAMTNAHHHAYLDKRGDGITTPANYKPWWMFTQEKDGLLSVVFCDLGIGIPKSLPRTTDEGWRKWWNTMKRWGLHRNGDAFLIAGAIRHSRTRTKLDHRGKGMRQIIDTVSSVDKGRAHIVSNKGWFAMIDGKETQNDMRVSIKGTLICWQVPLSGAAANA